MKLVKGSGSAKEGACWMSAIHWYVGEGKKGFQWSDHPDCVDPVIQALCIWLNDQCEDGEREKLIGPHLFAPVGTNHNKLLTSQRAFRVADWAVREIAPKALRFAKFEAEATKLETLAIITNTQTARAAWAAARDAAWAAGAAGVAGDVAGAAARAAARAAWAAWAAGVAGDVAGAAAEVAAWAARVAFDYKQAVLDLILELCAMGQKELKPAHTKQETLKCLETSFCEVTK